MKGRGCAGEYHCRNDDRSRPTHLIGVRSASSDSFREASPRTRLQSRLRACFTQEASLLLAVFFSRKEKSNYLLMVNAQRNPFPFHYGQISEEPPPSR